MDPLISVVIPVKNEARKIRECINGILDQTIKVEEIIVIDSGSTDGTLDILREYDLVSVIEIPSSDFNHGQTRNLGVSKAKGEFVVLTVGDARPFDRNWIEELFKGFDSEEVMAVCGQQVVPHEMDKNPLDWYRPQSKPQILKYQFSAAQFEELSEEELKNVCSWDDVTAMYRKEALLNIPFRKTSYSEDAIWAKDALAAGHCIVYNKSARVYHYHLEDAEFTFRRSFTTMYFRYKHFGFLYDRPVISWALKLRILKTIITSAGININEILRWYSYNINNVKAFQNSHDRFMDCLGQGDEYLDKVHEELCGLPPIPVKL